MDHDLLKKMRDSVARIKTAERPPQCDSWVDYATMHQHAGAGPCWQCAARERALREHDELEARLRTMRDAFAIIRDIAARPQVVEIARRFAEEVGDE